jgi:excisionase family DNA binding protein
MDHKLATNSHIGQLVRAGPPNVKGDIRTAAVGQVVRVTALWPGQTVTNGQEPAYTPRPRQPAMRPTRRCTETRALLTKPLLTVHEVAAMLKLKESTVRTLIVGRRIRAIKFGREWRVAVKDLEAFLNENANRED